MANLNKAEIMGNLGDTPVLRQTKSGTPVTDLSVATNRKYRSKDGEIHETTKWHRVAVWGKQAEACCLHLKKGNKVYVEGYMEDNIWEAADGTKHRDVRINAKDVIFVDHAEREISEEVPTSTEDFDQ